MTFKVKRNSYTEAFNRAGFGHIIVAANVLNLITTCVEANLVYDVTLN